MWVRGLKLVLLLATIAIATSHPMWVRGLKRSIATNDSNADTSHPMWVRGLKQKASLMALFIKVAPYVGAWIETWLC